MAESDTESTSSDSSIEAFGGPYFMLQSGTSANIIPGLIQSQSNEVMLINDLRQGHTKEKWTEYRPDMWPGICGLSDEKFRKKYKLTRILFADLAQKMPVHEDTNYRPATKKELRLAICLIYLATGDSFATIADAHGVGKSSAVEAINEGITMINRELAFPSFSAAELHGIVADFEAKGHFKGTAGCVDGTHIPIKVPEHLKRDYCNYKGFTSVILLGVCRSDLSFMFAHVGAPGSHGDRAVFNKTGLGPYLEKNLPAAWHLLGDSAFPLRTWLQTPYEHSLTLASDKRLFNYKLSSTRMSIERCFGLLKNRFRCLYKKLPFDEIEFSIDVVSACCRIHNLLIEGGVNQTDTSESEDSDIDDLPGPSTVSERKKANALGEMKRTLIKETLVAQMDTSRNSGRS